MLVVFFCHLIFLESMIVVANGPKNSKLIYSYSSAIVTINLEYILSLKI